MENQRNYEQARDATRDGELASQIAQKATHGIGKIRGGIYDFFGALGVTSYELADRDEMRVQLPRTQL
jgi:hypothetical protein